MTSTNPDRDRHAMDMLEPTSDAVKDHDCLLMGARNWRFEHIRFEVLACQSTAEYQELARIESSETVAAGRCGMVMRVFIEAQESLRAAAAEVSLVTRDENHRKRLRAGASSLHQFLGPLKFEQDQHKAAARQAREKRLAMEQAERDATRVPGTGMIENLREIGRVT